MKKLILLISALLTLQNLSLAQFKVGLNVLPAMVGNRIISNIDTLEYTNSGNSFKIPAGVFVDILLQENYYFNTGIYWAPKNIHVALNSSGGNINRELKLQYLQVPLTLKLKTDEISLDKRLFFQLGPALEILVDESLDNDPGAVYIDKFNFWDLSLSFSGGIEIKIGYNTAFIGGISYYRGMINSIKPISSLDGHFRINNDYYALNLGIIF